jgi:hypothetical protein
MYWEESRKVGALCGSWLGCFLGRCVVHQLATFIFLTIDSPLLKHTIDYANLVVERTPEVLQTARILQIEAGHKYASHTGTFG